jgi:hypothetical protein
MELVAECFLRRYLWVPPNPNPKTRSPHPGWGAAGWMAQGKILPSRRGKYWEKVWYTCCQTGHEKHIHPHIVTFTFTYSVYIGICVHEFMGCGCFGWVSGCLNFGSPPGGHPLTFRVPPPGRLKRSLVGRGARKGIV